MKPFFARPDPLTHPKSAGHLAHLAFLSNLLILSSLILLTVCARGQLMRSQPTHFQVLRADMLVMIPLPGPMAPVDWNVEPR